MSRRFVYLLSALASLAIALGLWRSLQASNRTPPRIPMQAGVVSNELGAFVCGNSRYSLDIAATPSESTIIHVVVDEGTSKYSVFQTGARKNEEWFVATDQYDRIWIFVGRSPDGSGRQIPSVFMFGLAFDDAGQIKTVCSEVSRTGDWDGVPEDFLSRVRAAASQLISNVPLVAPPLTSDRQHRLLAELDKHRTRR